MGRPNLDVDASPETISQILRDAAEQLAAARQVENAAWRPISEAPDGVRVLLGPREAPVVGMVEHAPQWSENQTPHCSVVHYNGNVLVPGYRCTEWRPLNAGTLSTTPGLPQGWIVERVDEPEPMIRVQEPNAAVDLVLYLREPNVRFRIFWRLLCDLLEAKDKKAADAPADVPAASDPIQARRAILAAGAPAVHDLIHFARQRWQGEFTYSHEEVVKRWLDGEFPYDAAEAAEAVESVRTVAVPHGMAVAEAQAWLRHHAAIVHQVERVGYRILQSEASVMVVPASALPGLSSSVAPSTGAVREALDRAGRRDPTAEDVVRHLKGPRGPLHELIDEFVKASVSKVVGEWHPDAAGLHEYWLAHRALIQARSAHEDASTKHVTGIVNPMNVPPGERDAAEARNKDLREASERTRDARNQAEVRFQMAAAALNNPSTKEIQ